MAEANRSPAESLSIDPDQIQRLIATAIGARANAHAPYSHYRVGAAVLANGRIFPGVNVENASYGGTICAERVALCSAIAQGCNHPTLVVVATPDVAAPCGICRQFMAEFGRDLTVLLVNSSTGQVVQQLTVDQLLPFPFTHFKTD